MDLNNINIVGRLTKQPELRVASSGISIASFTLAVGRMARDEVDFIDCVAFRQSAEYLTQYGDKGRVVWVNGRLQSRDWEDKQGNRRRSWEIIVNNLGFLGKGKSDED